MNRKMPQIARCETEHAMLRIDQTQGQCTLKHGCSLVDSHAETRE